MKSVIKFVGKSIFRTVVTRVVKDLIAAYNYTEYVKHKLSKDEQSFFKACNRVGMSDIQALRLAQIIEEEMERK
mgnify:FL=1